MTGPSRRIVGAAAPAAHVRSGAADVALPSRPPPTAADLADDAGRGEHRGLRTGRDGAQRERGVPRQAHHVLGRHGSTEIECTAPYLPDIGELDTYLALRPRG